MIEYKNINNKTRFVINRYKKARKYFNICVGIQERRKFLGLFFYYWKTKYKEYLNNYTGPADAVGYTDNWYIRNGYIIWNLSKMNDLEFELIIKRIYLNYQYFCYKNNFKDFKKFTQDLQQEQFIL